MRFNERSLVVLIGGGLAIAVAIVLVVMMFLKDGDDAPIREGSDDASFTGNAAEQFEGGPPEVMYLSGTALVLRDLEAGSDETLASVPTPGVYAAPGSSWVAYVTSRQADEGDFETEPFLQLFDTETGDKEGYGAGVAPVWNPSGTHVAFLRPTSPRECLGEECRGEVQIGVVEPATGQEWLLLEPGRYSILDWAGDRILVSDFESPAEVITVSLDDDYAELEVPANQMWGASPDGRWIIKTNAKKTEFVPLDGDELGDERIRIDLGEHQLLEGSWAHDSSQVAAVTSLTAGQQDEEGTIVPGEPTTQILTFSPEEPKPEMVDRTFGATGGILWAPDNDAIVFSHLIDPKKGLFQARYCPLGNQEECRIVTSWTEGVTLLRVE